MTAKANSSASDLNAVVSELSRQRDRRPDWPNIKDYSIWKIWQAVMLSLDIHPSKANRRRLEKSELAEEFSRRLQDLISQCGRDPRLPVSDAQWDEPADKSDRLLNLDDLLIFARATSWVGLSNLDKGLLGTASRLDGNSDAPVDPAGRTVRAEPARRDRYSLVRLGAVLELLKDAALNDKRGFPEYLNADGELNMSELGRKVHSVVTGPGGRTAGTKVVGTGDQTLKKEFLEARRLFVELAAEARPSSRAG